MSNVAVLRQSWRSWWSFSTRPSGPIWLQFLWTILFNTAIAVVLTLISWGFAGRADPWRMLGWNFVIAQSIGLTIHVLFDIGGFLIGHRANRRLFQLPARAVLRRHSYHWLPDRLLDRLESARRRCRGASSKVHRGSSSRS